MAKIWEKEWWTGRNDLYLDDAKIKIVYDDLESIKNREIQTARDDCREAIRNLNQVRGMEYVYQIGENSFDELYDVQIVSVVDAIKKQVEAKVADIEAYDNASFFEKVGSTLAMTGAKVGEGVLSVFESIGDGVISVAGFVGGVLGNKEFQDGCAEEIKKTKAHDVFNFYYNSDFAKASVYTENSGLASIAKLAGQTAGYLALGGFASGVGATWATSGKGVVKAIGTFAKSTTRVNTATAALGGLGQGTETGLNAGLDYKDAFTRGAAQGVAQGLLAWGFGKLGEASQRSAAVKGAEQQIDDAARIVENSKTALPSTSAEVNAKAAAELTKAKDVLAAKDTILANAKNATYQGYTDSITQAGQKLGTSLAQDGIKATVKTTIGNAATQVKDGFSNLGQKIGEGQLPKPNIGQKATPIESAKNAATTIYNNAPKPVRAAVELTGKVASAPVRAVGNIGKTMVSSVANVAKVQPTTLGKVATASIGVLGVGRGIAANYDNGLARTINTGLTAMEPDLQAMNNSIQTNTGLPINGTTNNGNTNVGNTNVTPPSGTTTGGPYGGNGQQTSTTPPGPGQTTGGTTTAPIAPTDVIDPSDGIDPVKPNPIDGTDDPKDSDDPTKPDDGDNKKGQDDPTKPEDKDTTTPTPTPTEPDHGGGGRTDYGDWSVPAPGDITEPEMPDGELPIEEPSEGDDLINPDETEESIYTIPTDLSGVATTKKKTNNNSALPILGGLGAAAAVGVGAKIYMDNKKNNDNGEDDNYEEDEFNFTDDNNLLADEWKENDDSSIDFNQLVNEASEENDDLGEI